MEIIYILHTPKLAFHTSLTGTGQGIGVIGHEAIKCWCGAGTSTLRTPRDCFWTHLYGATIHTKQILAEMRTPLPSYYRAPGTSRNSASYLSFPFTCGKSVSSRLRGFIYILMPIRSRTFAPDLGGHGMEYHGEDRTMTDHLYLNARSNSSSSRITSFFVIH